MLVYFVVQHQQLLCRGTNNHCRALPGALPGHCRRTAGSIAGALPGPDMFHVTLPESETLDMRGYLRDIEAALIESALRQKEGCVSHAADALRLQRTTLIEKIKKLGIEKPAARPM